MSSFTSHGRYFGDQHHHDGQPHDPGQPRDGRFSAEESEVRTPRGEWEERAISRHKVNLAQIEGFVEQRPDVQC